MKIFSNVIGLTMAVMIFILLSAASSFAQCVACATKNGAFVCVSSTNGGTSCTTSSGSCTLTGACPAKKIGASGVVVEIGINILTKMSVDSNLIMDIANVHPRFALAVA